MKLINVMAVSIDGRIASYPDEADTARRAAGFTNADDRAHLAELISGADAVIAGRRSLAASGGAWELPNQAGALPIWAILTRHGLPADAKFYTQKKIPRWLVSPAPLDLPPVGVENIVYGDRPAAEVLIAALAGRGVKRALLFGGGEVNRLFYAAGLVDELILTICPLILGASEALPLVSPPLPRAVKMSLVASQPKGNLVFLRYKVQKH